MATETLTFLSTDIEGSTVMLRRVGDVLRAFLAAHGGQEAISQGDGVFGVFASPRVCANGALQLHRARMSRGWPTGVRVRGRMGSHSGEVAEAAAGLAGVGMHRAARVAAVAHGG